MDSDGPGGNAAVDEARPEHWAAERAVLGKNGCMRGFLIRFRGQPGSAAMVVVEMPIS